MDNAHAPGPDDYEWVHTDEPYFGVAACVTWVSGMSDAGILAALGVDSRSTSVPFESDFDLSAEKYIGIANRRGGWVPLVELNGWQGSVPRLLCRLSRNGRAASMYWNVNMRSRLSLAENGELVFAFEVGDVHGEIEGDAGKAMEVARRVQASEGDTRDLEIGLAMLESITGVAFQANILHEIGSVYEMTDWS